MNEEDEDGMTIAYIAGAADARDQIRKLKIALADAIRRPLGVVPDSAEGLVNDADLKAAEMRRPLSGQITKLHGGIDSEW